jgi:hypothetical protein
VRVALALLLGSGVAHADIDEKGIRAGTVFTGLNHDNSIMGGGGSKPSFGLALGSFVALRTAPWFAFQLEAQLDLQRFELHRSNDEQIGNATAWCIEVPVLARFDTINSEHTKFYFVVGPSLVFSAGGEIDLAAGGTTELVGINQLNFAIAGGIGVQWTAGPGRISLDARYRRLLQPFTDGAQFFEDIGGDTGQPHMIEVFAGYAFP